MKAYTQRFAAVAMVAAAAFGATSCSSGVPLDEAKKVAVEYLKAVGAGNVDQACALRGFFEKPTEPAKLVTSDPKRLELCKTEVAAVKQSFEASGKIASFQEPKAGVVKEVPGSKGQGIGVEFPEIKSPLGTLWVGVSKAGDKVVVVGELKPDKMK